MVRPWLVLLLTLSAFAGCVDEGPDEAGRDATEVGPAAADAEYGAARVLLHAPSPWFVEGLAVHGDRGFTGTALGATGTGVPLLTFGEPSRIYVFDLVNATLLETIYVEGEDANAEHGIAGLTTDGDGRLYAASTQLGVLRFTESADGWTQETYAVIPDIPPCTLGGDPCSPTPDDQPAIPNDLTWDAEGDLYVSDSFQATVWRIPPGAAREAEVWYQHASLDRAFGPNGLRISPAGDEMFLAVCCLDAFALGPVDRASRIVTLPFPDPTGAEPADFYVFGNQEGADGIEFNETGALYVASNFGTRIVVIDPDGTAARTITNADLSGGPSFDFPASVTFYDEARSMVVTNYAFSDATSADDQRYVLEVFVDDAGAPRIRPVVP